ncbi:MAG: Rab family GTPase [Candidatus Helarchaeota archaeon]
MERNENILVGIIYNGMLKVGPGAKAYYPKIEFFDRPKLNLLAIKSITLLTGEEGEVPERISIILFAKYHLLGIVYHFEVTDPSSRGGVVDSNLVILFNEKYSSIAYKYSDLFQLLLKEVSKKINEYEQNNDIKNIEKLLENLYNRLIQNLDNLRKAEQDALKHIPEKKADYSFKVVLIGDGKVGKTTTLFRYIDNCFKESYLPTIGVNVTNKIITIGNKNIKLNFFDIAGQKKFELMRRVFYDGLNAALILFDVTNIESFQHLEDWLTDVQSAFHKENIVGLILGNKIDLKNKRIVNKSDAELIAKKYGLDYMEISAKTGENINEAFFKLAKRLISK